MDFHLETSYMQKPPYVLNATLKAWHLLQTQALESHVIKVCPQNI